MAKKNLHVPELEKLRGRDPLLYEALNKIVKHVNQQNQTTEQTNTNQGSK